jgi:acyl-CoA-binding protein
MRYLQRVNDTFELTNVSLLKHALNKDALLTILQMFKQANFGTSAFKDKIATILQTIVQKNLWETTKSSSEIADLISCLRSVDPIKFETLLFKILEDFRVSVSLGNCTSR